MVDRLNPHRCDFATWIQKFSARRGYYPFARDAGGIFETVWLNSLEANGDFASGRILSEFQRIRIVVAKRNTITHEA